MELYNEPAFNRLMKNVAKLLSLKGNKLSFQQVTPKAAVEQEEDTLPEENDDLQDEESVNSELSDKLPTDSDEEGESDSDGDWADLKLDEYKVLEDGEKGKHGRENQPKKTYAKTEVDDQFFKVREMEEFLEKEEKPKPAKTDNDDDDDDEEGFDFFGEDFSDDEENVCIQVLFSLKLT